MPHQDFQFDVFLSHSSKDQSVVHELAARLKKDGVRVWMDTEQIKPGDSIPVKIEEGLEQSRVLLLCMSANAFGSDWAQLESGTFRFRDPLNKERRFVPLRLDDTPVKGSLAQFLYINWCAKNREQEYIRLLEVCRSSLNQKTDFENDSDKFVKKIIVLKSQSEISEYIFSEDRRRAVTRNRNNDICLWDLGQGQCEKILRQSFSSGISSIGWFSNEKLVLTGSVDWNLRLWNIETSGCELLLEGKRGNIYSVALSPNEKRILSGTINGFIELWNLEWKHAPQFFEKHMGAVTCIAWSPDGSMAASGADDMRAIIWTIIWPDRPLVLKGHKHRVTSVAWSYDQKFILSGSEDTTVRLWEVASGKCLKIFEGHTETITSIDWNKNSRYALTGSADCTMRLWDVKAGSCLFIFDRHKVDIQSVKWHNNGVTAYSGDRSGKIIVWDLSEFLSKPAAAKIVPPKSKTLDQIQYTNAKVLLVGESGVGKTGLSNYLVHDIKVEENKPLPSTDGAWATQWLLRHERKKNGVEREIWLWDFAGQVDYRLVHQLFMDDTAAAVLVFNPQNENPFEGLGHWDRDLQKAAQKPFAKLLAAARVDRGGLVVSAATMKKFMEERSFCGPLHITSAKTGEGCNLLRDSIVQSIDWKSIPETTSPALYHRLKQEILSLRDSGLVLVRLAELKQRMEMTLREENFDLTQLEAVVGLLTGPGMIQRLDFGGFILLRPEVLSRYAAALVRKVRKHPQELGCIREDELLAGDLDYQDFRRLGNKEDEKVVLRALLELFISRAWCLRQPCEGSAILTFPSYFRRERKEQPSHPSVLVTYRFDGPVDDIYATLVVRLHHTVAFESTDLWRSAADFKTQLGAKLGFTLLRDSEGTSRLEVYFEPDVDENSRVLFLRYVHDHLMQNAQNVVRLRRYYCRDKNCDGSKEPFPDQAKLDKALAPGGKAKVFCPDCGQAIVLLDVIEQKFDSAEVKEQSREQDAEAQVALDNESRELILVGHAFLTVAEAGQIYRGYTNSDHGIDGEIEFKDDQGQASGKRLYVQLKSGDSYLKKRQSDGAEIFQVKNSRWADYWQQQAYAVMLVIRTSDGEIRWMDVSAHLKRETAGGKTVKQIVFAGERFDAVNVQHWRKKILGLPGK